MSERSRDGGTSAREHEPVDDRLRSITGTLEAFARRDFAARAEMGDCDDAMGAVAAGLNMLGEEFDVDLATRAEVEQTRRGLAEVRAQLEHADRLATLGQLACGVAHEINNPATTVTISLSVIEHAAASLLERAAADDSGASQLRRIEASARDAAEAMRRIAALCADLLRHGRIDGDAVGDVALNEVVAASCRMVGMVTGGAAMLQLELEPVPPIRGHAHRLGQVATNLVLNAVQALPERAADRRIRVGTRSGEGHVLLFVDDAGAGVPVTLRTQIFEPFYTTKPASEGTGLGLALARDIVHAHGGTLRVVASDRGGARFEATLPTGG